MIVCAVWGCSLCLGDSGDPLSGCCRRGRNKWYQSFQASLGISGDSENLIRWRSCVDLRSEVLVFVGSCVDLRRTQEGLVESVV